MNKGKAHSTVLSSFAVIHKSALAIGVVDSWPEESAAIHQHVSSGIIGKLLSTE